MTLSKPSETSFPTPGQSQSVNDPSQDEVRTAALGVVRPVREREELEKGEEVKEIAQ